MQTTDTTKPAAARATFTIELKPGPGVENPALALRGLLKIALRRFGLRCVAVHETIEESNGGIP